MPFSPGLTRLRKRQRLGTPCSASRRQPQMARENGRPGWAVAGRRGGVAVGPPRSTRPPDAAPRKAPAAARGEGLPTPRVCVPHAAPRSAGCELPGCRPVPWGPEGPGVLRAGLSWGGVSPSLTSL